MLIGPVPQPRRGFWASDEKGIKEVLHPALWGGHACPFDGSPSIKGVAPCLFMKRPSYPLLYH